MNKFALFLKKGVWVAMIQKQGIREVFHFVLLGLCKCVCAYKVRCGLSLSIEVWDFWRGTLCGVSEGHVRPQKELINGVVINGDGHKCICLCTHTHMQMNIW